MRGDGPLIRIGHAVAAGHLLGNLVQSDAADLRGGAGEVPVDDGLVQADRLEQLGAAVAHDGGDAHLAHDLEHADRQGVRHVRHGRGRIDREVAAAGLVLHGLERQVRVHAGGAVGDEQRDVVDLAHVAGLHGQRDLGARVPAQQVMLDRGGEQQRRDRRPRVVRAAVGEHDEVRAVGDRPVDVGEDLVEPRFERGAAAGDLVQALDDERPVVAVEDGGAVEPLELRHLLGVDDRQRDQDLLGVQLGVLQQVRLGADRRFQTGDDPFALPVERRVGDLRELLREVVEQHAAAVGEHGHRRIVAHRAERLLAGVRHGVEDQLDVLLGVAEGALAAEHRFVGVVDVFAGGQFVHVHAVALHPLPVRVLRGERVLDLVVGHDAAFGGVHKEHPPRFQTPLGAHVFGGHVGQHAGFGGEHDQAGVVQLPAARSEAVAVEQRADLRAVGEDDVRRTVPRFDQRVVVLVEGAHVGVERVVVLPGGRQHHQDGVRQAAAGQVQQFQAFVEGAGIRVSGRGDRQQRLELAEQFGAQTPLARLQPVAVALDGVDLAVVGEQAEGLGQRPAGERVGGEARVHDGHARRHPLVVEVREEPGQLHGGQHALVGDGPAGQRGEVHAHLVLHALADAERLALQIQPAQGAVRGGDDQRDECGHRGQRLQSQPVRIGGYGTPGERFQPLLAHDGGNGLLLAAACGGVPVQERDARRVMARFRQRRVDHGPHERVGHAHQDARAVAGVLLGAHRAAVVQVPQHLDGLVDDAPLRPTVHRGHHADAAGVVFRGGVVEPLLASDGQI